MKNSTLIFQFPIYLEPGTRLVTWYIGLPGSKLLPSSYTPWSCFPGLICIRNSKRFLKTATDKKRCFSPSVSDIYPFSHNHGSGKITRNERKLILKGAIFHFHDYGREGRCVLLRGWIAIRIQRSDWQDVFVVFLIWFWWFWSFKNRGVWYDICIWDPLILMIDDWWFWWF